MQIVTQDTDKRLKDFLASFAKNGWHSVEFGFFKPDTEWDPRCKEYVSVNNGEHYNLFIKDGIILNKGEILNVLSILDTAGIKNALPAFNGKELGIYTLDDDGKNWISSDKAKGEGFFYTSFYSIG